MACAVPQHCSGRLIALIRVYFAFLLIPAAGAAAGAWLMWGPVVAVIPAALCVAVVWAVVFLAPMYYESLTYTRCRDWLKIERGIICRQIVLVPRRQVQYVTLRANPLEKLLGIRTLTFMTSGGRVSLGGLMPEDAARMRALFENCAVI